MDLFCPMSFMVDWTLNVSNVALYLCKYLTNMNCQFHTHQMIWQTTASSMTWILLALATHPDIQTKARDDVIAHLPRSGQPITPEVLDHMTYVNCVVKEGLR